MKSNNKGYWLIRFLEIIAAIATAIAIFLEHTKII